jgi:anhydro-N-acetylmuramic acid kinase
VNGLYVGVITGTSVDGLDLALLEIDSKIRFAASETVALRDDLRDELISLGQPGQNEIDRLGAADARLGRAIGEAINEFLANEGVDPKAVSAIGSHGQTVRHAWPISGAGTWPPVGRERRWCRPSTQRCSVLPASGASS